MAPKARTLFCVCLRYRYPLDCVAYHLIARGERCHEWRRNRVYGTPLESAACGDEALLIAMTNRNVLPVHCKGRKALSLAKGLIVVLEEYEAAKNVGQDYAEVVGYA